MLGIQLILISLAVYASGQGVSYSGSSNIRNQGQRLLPPRRTVPYLPGSNGLRPVYKPPQPVYQPPQPVDQPPQPVYQPPQPIYQPPRPIYQPPQPIYRPPQPDYSNLPVIATEAPTTKQPILPPIAPQPARPLYPVPLAPRRPSEPAPPVLITEPPPPAPVSEINKASTPKEVDVVYPQPPSLPELDQPALPAPVDTTVTELEPPLVSQPNPFPGPILPTTSEPVDIEINKPNTSPTYPQPIPLQPVEIRPEPVSSPQPSPQPDNDPGLYIPTPTTVLPTEETSSQETWPTPRPTPRPTPVPIMPPAPAPIAPLDPLLIEPILPLKPTPLPPQVVPIRPPSVAYPKPPTVPVRPVRPPVNPPSIPQPTIPVGPTMTPLGVLPITLLEDFQCTKGNAYYTVLNNCDTYIECENDRAYSQTCPDGLHFNPHAVYPQYPCAYPSEVKCDSFALNQEPKPTNECPRRYGLFPLPEGDCSQYLTCQEGKATVMNCPFGLVFNDQLSSCDWPENVPQCSLRAFKDFTCPIPPVDDEADLIYKYRYGSDCKFYVACQRGHPRLLKCDTGMSFDESSQVCIDSDLVRNCGAL